MNSLKKYWIRNHSLKHAPTYGDAKRAANNNIVVFGLMAPTLGVLLWGASTIAFSQPADSGEPSNPEIIQQDCPLIQSEPKI